jgi:hypothetical protein
MVIHSGSWSNLLIRSSPALPSISASSHPSLNPSDNRAAIRHFLSILQIGVRMVAEISLMLLFHLSNRHVKLLRQNLRRLISSRRLKGSPHVAKAHNLQGATATSWQQQGIL